MSAENKGDGALACRLGEQPNRRIGNFVGFEQIREETILAGRTKTEMTKKDSRVHDGGMGMGRKGLKKAGNSQLFEA